MSKRGLVICVGCICAALLLASCKKTDMGKTAEEPGEKDSLEIGITFDTFVLERWTRDRDVFVSTAQKLGAKVDVQNANGEVKKQIQQIERFIEAGVDTIVVIPVDCYALSEVITKARNKGIDVISYDRMVQGTTADLYITVDNEQVGQLMAQTIKENIPPDGNVVMICGPKMDTNSLDVVTGFKQEMQGSDLQIVRETYVKSWTPEYGALAANEAFRDVSRIDAVMCGNDGLASYAIQAFSEQQMAGSVVVVGQDADLEACQRIVEGTQTMTVYKPIEDLARIAAECAVRFAKGEPVPEKVKVKMTTKQNDAGYEIPYYGLTPIAVTKENMDEVIIDSGFHVRDEVYLNVD